MLKIISRKKKIPNDNVKGLDGVRLFFCLKESTTVASPSWPTDDEKCHEGLSVRKG